MLLLTLPLRSFAAVTTYGGDPTQHRDSVSVFDQLGVDAAAAYQHGAGSTSDRHHHGGSADLHSAACSVSCAGAMSGSFFSIASANVIAVSRIIALVDHSYAGFIPEGPERPPRVSLC